jgi:hypothetical protein
VRYPSAARWLRVYVAPVDELSSAPEVDRESLQLREPPSGPGRQAGSRRAGEDCPSRLMRDSSHTIHLISRPIAHAPRPVVRAARLHAYLHSGEGSVVSLAVTLRTPIVHGPRQAR